MSSNRREPLRLLIAILIAGSVLALVGIRVTRETRVAREQRSGVLGVVIHHSATPQRVHGKLIDAASIDEYHAKRNWRVVVNGKTYHIGYNFVILQDGTVQRGRPVGVRGAHAGVAFFNEHYIGICLVGDFDTLSNRNGVDGPLRPPKKQLDAAVKLVVALARRYGFDANHVIPHRAVHETECPGNRFPMAELRERVRKALASGSGQG